MISREEQSNIHLFFLFPGAKKTRTHRTSFNCGTGFSSSLFPIALPHAEKTWHCSMSRFLASHQGCAAADGGSSRSGGSLVDVECRAELHTAMPVYCCLWNHHCSFHALSPLLISREACLSYTINM